MAVQFTDFSQAPLLDSPYKNLIEDVFKGYQLSQMPREIADKQKQRMLSNQLKQLEVEHKPREFELNDKQKELANALQDLALKHRPKEYELGDALKQAQIQKALREPSNQAKFNGILANYVASHPNASQDEIKEFADKALNAQISHLNAITGRSEDITAGSSFDKLPTNEKKREVGLMTAMGLDPVEATKLLRKGLSPSEYAKQQGVDISAVTPQYPLGEQNVKDIQRTKSYFDEMDSLEKNISQGLGPYQNKIMGYSLDQIADAFAGDSPEKQGKALAARALLPELSALRLKIAGGNIGIEAIRELEEKSLGQLKIIESLVDTPTFLAAQKYMSDWIQDAGRRRIKSLEDYGRLKKSAEAESKAGKVYNLATRQWEDE